MGFEQLLNIYKYNKEQEEIGREEELAECPEDCYPLQINSRGQKSCPICGRIWNEGLY